MTRYLVARTCSILLTPRPSNIQNFTSNPLPPLLTGTVDISSKSKQISFSRWDGIFSLIHRADISHVIDLKLKPGLKKKLDWLI